MEEYIGLDVSMKETAVSIRRDRQDGSGAASAHPIPESVASSSASGRQPPNAWCSRPAHSRCGFITSLRTEGLPAICIDARHAKAALDMAANKTDANDADGLAQLAEVGFFREVRVKGFDSMLTRTLVAARTQAGQDHDRALQPDPRSDEDLRPGRSCRQGQQVREERPEPACRPDGLASIVLPILEAWRGMRIRAAELGRQLVAGRAQESGLPAADVHSRRRCDHRNRLHHSH